MAIELKQLIDNIDKIFSKIVYSCDIFTSEDHTIKTIDTGYEIIKNGRYFLDKIKYYENTLKSTIDECQTFIEDVKNDLSQPKKKEPYVYLTTGGMLSYPGRDIISEIDISRGKKQISDINISKKKKHTSEKVHINELKHDIKINIVENLQDIPPAIYYVKDNEGFYINLGNNNYAKIPFPDIVDYSKEHDKKMTISCKYFNKSDCDNQRLRMSKLYGTQLRSCNFAHKNERLIKIGYHARCPSVPNFGNPATINIDIKKINNTDLNNLLLYGLNDLFCAIMYLDFIKQKNTTLGDLDIVK